MKEKSNTSGFIFDGSPRTLQEAKELDQYLSSQGIKIDAVLGLEVDNDRVLVDRILLRGLTSGRKDDVNELTIKERLIEYNLKTKPVVDPMLAAFRFNTPPWILIAAAFEFAPLKVSVPSPILEIELPEPVMAPLNLTSYVLVPIVTGPLHTSEDVDERELPNWTFPPPEEKIREEEPPKSIVFNVLPFWIVVVPV